MDRETFEQLVSAWLDEPQDAALRARLEAGVENAPALRQLRDEWVRLDRLVRSATPPLNRVDWSAFRACVCSALLMCAENGAGRAGPLEAALTALPSVEDRVDWRRFQRRVSRAVARAARQQRGIRLRWRTVVGAGGLLAAAAALLLAFLLPRASRSERSGVAVVQLVPVTTPLSGGGPGVAVARVAAQVADERAANSPAGQHAAAAEVFLMIEPVPPQRPTPAEAEPIGFY